MGTQPHLSRRERQIMDAVYARGEASAAVVRADMHDAPSPAAVRTMLRILEEKGHLKHRKNGREFVYSPTQPRRRAARSALDRVLKVFFGGSMANALALHLLDEPAKVGPEELKQLASLIRQARKQGM